MGQVVFISDYRPKQAPMHPVLDIQVWWMAIGLATLGALIEASLIWWPENDR